MAVPTLSNEKTKNLGINVTCKSIDHENRTINVIMSTKGQDRQGDIVEPKGLDFSDFIANPVVLWAHDLIKPPIGKVLRHKSYNDRVEATVQFADSPFALEIFDLYAKGFLKGWSIGFLPVEWERIEADEKKGVPSGFRIIRAKVVELSAVPVPANAESLSKALEAAKDDALHAALKAVECTAIGVDLGAPEGSKTATKTLSFGAKNGFAIALPDGVFEKTFAARADAKFPVKFLPIPEGGVPQLHIDYEAVQEDGDTLVEAKMLGITLAVLQKTASAPEGGAASDAGGTDNDQQPSGDDDAKALARHQREKSARDARARMADLQSKALLISQ